MTKVNLCGTGLKGFINIDVSWKATPFKRVDLEKKKIPMRKNSVDVLICMNGIGYFTKERGQYIINDVHRILKPGGVCRFGTQDFAIIAREYLAENPDFQMCRINEWFRGYVANKKECKYVYDAITLWELFHKFSLAVRCKYKVSPRGIGEWDNREEQQFFIEAIK